MQLEVSDTFLPSGCKKICLLKPKKIISFNSIRDFDVEIKKNKILNKKGSYYFDNVDYDKIIIDEKSAQKTNYEESQNITQAMRRSINQHRKIFYYQKKIKNYF